MSSYRNSRSGGGGTRLSACHHHHHQTPSSPSYSYYYYSSSPSSSAFASSTTSSFGSTRSSSSASSFHHHRYQQQQHHHHHHQHHSYTYNRSSSPTRVNFVGSGHMAPSVRFSIDPRSISPGRSLAAYSARERQISVHHHQHHHHHHQQQQHHHHYQHPQQRRTCMCSPTTHPGSFRCSLHKNAGGYHGGGGGGQSVSSSPNRLNARRSAMTNSLVRIGAVEGELVKRALASLIRPSSHQQRRKAAFQPRLSRLSIMSKAGDNDDDAISLC